MMPSRFLIALFLCSPLVASAASGSWSGDSVGGIVSVGRQPLKSRPLVPALPTNAQVHTLSWRITLLTPPPAGLTVKLCNPRRCLGLASLSGQVKTDAALFGQEPLHFVYSVETPGRLAPPLNVVRNEITLNYR